MSIVQYLVLECCTCVIADVNVGLLLLIPDWLGMILALLLDNDQYEIGSL